jgi:hypothetical protein
MPMATAAASASPSGSSVAIAFSQPPLSPTIPSTATAATTSSATVVAMGAAPLPLGQPPLGQPPGAACQVAAIAEWRYLDPQGGMQGECVRYAGKHKSE